MKRFFTVAVLIMRKDLRVETRSLELFLTTLFFAVSSVLVFAFWFCTRWTPGRERGSGNSLDSDCFRWERSPSAELLSENDITTSCGPFFLAPVDRPAIYVGKLLGILAFIGLR